MRPIRRPRGLSRADATDIFLSQLTSRQMDRLSRTLQARGEGFYTIGSSGHEGNAAVAAALRVTDMAFLHYRSNAFQLHRARQVPGQTPTWDMLLSFAASSEDPISGGRHKVIGSKPLNIPPQTSTIASHLPKAVGAAFSIGIARRLGMTGLAAARRRGGADQLRRCVGEPFDRAGRVQHRGLGGVPGLADAAHLPVRRQWHRHFDAHPDRAGSRRSSATAPGCTISSATAAILCRPMPARAKPPIMRARYRKPVFLHMATVRLYGHAGSDVQGAYLPKALIEADEARDPLLAGAALMAQQGWMTPAEIADAYEDIGATLARQAEAAILRPKITTPAQVMESIVPPKRDIARANTPSDEDRKAMFGSDAGAMDKPQHMARLLQLGARRPDARAPGNRRHGRGCRAEGRRL